MYNLFKFLIQQKKMSAFTLAELMSVIVILGVVATLIIPSSVHNATQRANRAKIIKAMSTYEKVMSNYYLDNEYKNYLKEYNAATKTFNETIAPIKAEYNNSSYTRDERYKAATQARTNARNQAKSNAIAKFESYFKISRRDPNNSSLFKTPDGLWWNVGTDPKFFQVIVAFKQEDATDDIARGSDAKAFIFTAELPDYARTPITNKKTEDFPSMSSGKEERQKLMAYLIENSNGSTNSKNLETSSNKSFASTKLYSYINGNDFTNNLGYFCTSGRDCCKNKKGLCATTDTYDNNKLRKQIFVYRDGLQVYSAYSYSPDNGVFYWESYTTTDGGYCVEYRTGFTEGDCGSKIPAFKK